MTKQEELEIIQNKIKEIDLTRSPLVKQEHKLLDEIRNEMLEAKYSNFIATPESVMNLNAEEYGSYKGMYQLVEQYFHSFKSIFRSGYYPETNQIAVKVGMRQSVPLSEQVSEIKQFIPFIKEREASFKDENNKVINKNLKSIRIFEYTLSSSAIYTLYFEQEEMILVASSGGWSKVLLRVKNEEETVMWKYILDNHPYDKKQK